jgi:uncharacterized FlaG/YvyC family protein
MGQVSVSALRAIPLPESTPGVATSDRRARSQAIVSAVQVINQSGFIAADREVTYSTDNATKQLVIQVVDRQSKQVLVQWPSDYALQMAEEFQKEHPTNESLL